MLKLYFRNSAEGASWQSGFRQLPAAFALGFVSMGFQIGLVSTISSLFGNSSAFIGIALAAWIFLTGAGSILVRRFENWKNKSTLLWLFYLALPSLAIVSNIWITGLYPSLMVGNHISVAALSVLVLLAFAPLCLANGALFSLLAQESASAKVLKVNIIYAIESVGGLLGGVLFYVLPSAGMEMWIVTNFAVLAFAYILSSGQPIKTKVFLLMLFCLATILFWKIGQAIGSPSISVTNALLVQSGQPIYYAAGFWIFLILSVFLLSRFPPVGRTLFVAGFAGLSIEMLLILLYEKICAPLLPGSGIIISICMAGLALGALLPQPSLVDAKKHFTRLLLGLTILSVSVVIFLTFKNSLLPTRSLLIGAILLFGGLFSLISGALFATGVNLQKGSAGGVVATTYGPDMMGASLGALIVSSMLLPTLGISGVASVTSVLLLSSTLLTWMWRP